MCHVDASDGGGGVGESCGGQGDRYGDAVQVCSFELWEGGSLVAGEFGCVVGCSYTSFSGFHSVDSAGSVQMLLTARLLETAGFEYWDMGQVRTPAGRGGGARWVTGCGGGDAAAAGNDGGGGVGGGDAAAAAAAAAYDDMMMMMPASMLVGGG